MLERRWIGFALLVYLKRLRQKLGSPAEDAGPDARLATIPRIVWMFWDKGEANAPEVVRFAIESWRRRNPTWQVRVLDLASVPAATDMPPLPRAIPIQAYADVLRLQLLRHHGGVWADATLVCATPLDHWLPTVARSGFFAFARPGPDRVVSSWFLASEPDGRIVKAWYRASAAYWAGRKRAHAYFWLHYLFEYLTYRDRGFREAWARVPKISAMPARLARISLKSGRDPAALREMLATGAVPVHKLDWRYAGDLAPLLDLEPDRYSR